MGLKLLAMLTFFGLVACANSGRERQSGFNDFVFTTNIRVPSECRDLQMDFDRGMGSEEQKIHCVLSLPNAMSLAKKLTGKEARSGYWPYLYKGERDPRWWTVSREGHFFGASWTDGKSFRRILISTKGDESEVWISVGHI